MGLREEVTTVDLAMLDGLEAMLVAERYMELERPVRNIVRAHPVLAAARVTRFCEHVTLVAPSLLVTIGQAEVLATAREIAGRVDGCDWPIVVQLAACVGERGLPDILNEDANPVQARRIAVAGLVLAAAHVEVLALKSGQTVGSTMVSLWP